MSIRILAKSLFWLCCALVAWGTLLAPSGGVDWFPYQDKVMHFGAFATLACTGLTGYPRSRFWLLVGLVAFAVGIEIIQTYIPVRSAEVADFLADIVGIFVGFAAARIGQLIMND